MNERFARASAVARVDLAHEPDFLLGAIEIRPSLRELARDGWRETIDRRVMQVLVALARANGKVVSRDDLIESCWDGVIVGDEAINRCISRLRRAAEASGNAFSIETLSRVGYRLKIPDIAATGTEAGPAREPESGIMPRLPPASAAPQRVLYRGLQSLDEQDEAIFFGRDAPLAEGLDALRGIRDTSARSMLVILGASGAGKSSFLKAGLLARLKRDGADFLVLPVIRPERAALSGTYGLAACLSCDPADLTGPQDFAGLFAKLRGRVIERATRTAANADEIRAARPTTIVISIDQAEELFTAENTEAGHVLELLAGAVRADPDTIIVATIRSDAFERLQCEPRLADIKLLPFSLAPLPHGAFKEVIEGPARLAEPKLTIEPALTEQLLRDLASADALPLLAFTLERLWLRHRGGGTLSLAEYADDLGGLQGAITVAVEMAFEKARRDPAMPHERAEIETMARAAFIPSLVQLDDANGEPRRRVERLDALPKATLPLVRHLINQRVLVSDWSAIDGIETDTVEVAHEAILRQWPALRAWIAEERDALIALDGVRTAAVEWHKHASPAGAGQSESWLTHQGGRLEEAEKLITRPGFSNFLNERELEYLNVCRKRENAERLREKQGIARTRRLQRNIGVLILIAAVVLLITGAGIVQLLAGIAARSSDTLATLAAKEADAGYYDRAARYALAGLDGADRPLIGFRGDAAQAELVADGNESNALALLRGHNGFVFAATFSPDGRRIVTASQDGTARIWDAKTAGQIAVLRGHEGLVWSVAYSPDGRWIVTASNDKTARIWDARTDAQIAVLRGHQATVRSAAFSADGRLVVTASNDKTARIWDSTTARPIAQLSGHEDSVVDAVFSPDGRRVVTASSDKTARIWDTSTGRQIAVLRGHDDVVESAAFSPDGRRIVTASDDKTVRIWDVNTGLQTAILRGHQDTVEYASFSPDGNRIVTASDDGTVRIWDAKTARQITILRGHEDFVNAAAFSPDGTRIVTGSNDGTARIWNASAAHQVAILVSNNFVTSAAFSPDGRRIVTTAEDNSATIWNADSARQLMTLRGHDDEVFAGAFSRDGRRIITGSADDTARIWDASTGRQIAVLRGHDSDVHGVGFSPDGRWIVTASSDKTARIWDANTGRQVAVLRGHDATVHSAVFSPDGKRIVTSSYDGTARIWDARTRRQIAVLRGHADYVLSAAFSPDGTRIVTTSRDRTARIWDSDTMRETAILRGHTDYVYSAAFSPDGRYVATASVDKTVRIWDANSGTQIAILRGHENGVYGVAFSPDGTRIVTASQDKTARIWNVSRIASVPRAELVRRICETTLANGLSKFSQQELRAAPALDPQLDTDACHPPSIWARVGRIFSAALSH